MNIDELKRQLGPNSFKTSQNIDTDHEFYSAQYLPSTFTAADDPDFFSDHVIYVPYAKTFKDSILPADKKTYLAAGNDFTRKIAPDGATTLIVFKELSTLDVFKVLQNIFLKQCKTDNDLLKINVPVMDGSLQEMLDAGYSVLHNPLVYVPSDRSHILFSINPNDKAVYENPELYQFMKNVDIFDIDKNLLHLTIDGDLGFVTHQKITQFENPIIHCSMYSVPIVIYGSVVGVLYMLESESKIGENFHEFFTQLAISLSISLLKKNFFHENRGSAKKSFLADLLSEHVMNQREVQENLSIINYVPKKEFFVCDIMCNNSLDTAKRFETIIQKLKPYISDHFYSIYQNQLVILFNFNDKHDFFKYTYNILDQLGETEDLSIGISNASSNILDTPKMYRQAVNAAVSNLRRHEASVIFYKEMAYLSLIREYNASMLVDLCDPDILMLLKSPDPEDHVLFYTLYVYLKLSENTEATANFLYIHKNTVLYRINKVKKKLNLNLNSSDIRMRLILSYQILGYLGMLDGFKTIGILGLRGEDRFFSNFIK